VVADTIAAGKPLSRKGHSESFFVEEASLVPSCVRGVLLSFLVGEAFSLDGRSYKPFTQGDPEQTVIFAL